MAPLSGHGRGAGRSAQGDIGFLRVGLSNHLVNLSHIGVDSHDGDIVSVLIQESLDLGAVAHIAGHGTIELELTDLQVIALGNLGKLVSLHTIHIDLSLFVLIGHTQVGVDLADLHVGGVGGISGLGEGANLDALEAPGVSRTAEVINGVGLQNQLVEVLLSKLDKAVILDIAVIVGGSAPRLILSLVASNGDGGAVHVNRGFGIVLHHGGLQHVERIQGSLFTGHSLGADELIVAVIQADTGGLLDDINSPVGASVAFNGAVIAQGTQ